MLVICSNMNDIDVKIYCLDCIYDMRIGQFDSIFAFQFILNVLLEHIEPFNTVQCIKFYMRLLFY